MSRVNRVKRRNGCIQQFAEVFRLQAWRAYWYRLSTKEVMHS